MKTQLMNDAAREVAQLEYYPAKGGPAERLALDQLPLTIGRDQSAMLRLDSTRVSREHAAIVEQGRTYRVRDLGSTNGTFLNGERVTEAELTDGDILLVADVEMTFLCGSAGVGRVTATQLLDSAPRGGSKPKDGRAVIAEVRQLNQQLIEATVRTRFRPVVRLASLETIGYVALEHPGEAGMTLPDAPTFVTGVDCRLSDRLRRAARLAAVGQATRLPADAVLFVSIHPSELGCDRLIESLRQARRRLGEPRQLIVQVPESAAGGAAYFKALRNELTELAIGVAYSRFSAGHAHLLEHQERPPDYLFLDPSLVLHIERSARRQTLIEGLVRVCSDLNVVAVADGIRTGKEAETCEQLGVHLGQGEHFGHPQPAVLLGGSAA